MRLIFCFLIAIGAWAQTYSDAQIAWPPYRGGAATSGTAMNNSNISLGFRWTAKKACTVTKVHVYLSAVTTAQTITVSLQNLDASLYPDGTPDQSGNITPATGWNVATLGASRTVAAGDRGAAVLVWASTQGSVTSGGNSTISVMSQPEIALPTVYTAAWANGSTNAPGVGLECDDGSFIPTDEGVEPLGVTQTDIASNTNPDELGNRFKLPFGAKACGATFYGRRESASTREDLVLYNSGGTSLASCSTTYHTGNATAKSCYFSSQITLAADTEYHIVVKPTTTNATRVYWGLLPDADALKAIPGNIETYYSARVDAGSFSTDTTKRAAVSVELCSVAAGTAAASGSAHTWIK